MFAFAFVLLISCLLGFTILILDSTYPSTLSLNSVFSFKPWSTYFSSMDVSVFFPSTKEEKVVFSLPFEFLVGMDPIIKNRLIETKQIEGF